MRVLWLSRHSPTPEQESELQKKFGRDTDIIEVSATVSSGQEVIDLMKRYKCDEVVAVLPINLVAEVVALGVKPIRAIMIRRLLKDGVEFQFSHYERIEKVEIVSTPL